MSQALIHPAHRHYKTHTILMSHQWYQLHPIISIFTISLMRDSFLTLLIKAIKRALIYLKIYHRSEGLLMKIISKKARLWSIKFRDNNIKVRRQHKIIRIIMNLKTILKGNKHFISMKKIISQKLLVNDFIMNLKSSMSVNLNSSKE